MKQPTLKTTSEEMRESTIMQEPRREGPAYHV